MHVTRTDSAREYWFLYEGPPGVFSLGLVEQCTEEVEISEKLEKLKKQYTPLQSNMGQGLYQYPSGSKKSAH